MVTALHSLVAKYKGFPGGSSGKELTCNVGAVGSIPGSGRSLEGEMAHSSILAWRIPWTEESGVCATVHASQRVGHDWIDLACMHTAKYKNIHEWKLLNKINFVSEIMPSWHCVDCWRRSLRGCDCWFTQEQDQAIRDSSSIYCTLEIYGSPTIPTLGVVSRTQPWETNVLP